jgi:hypothetical protein
MWWKKAVALEDSVVTHHPQVGLADEGLQHRRGDVEVVVRTERVADVVQQRAHHVLLVAAVAPRSRGGVQGVRAAVHGKAAVVALEQTQVRHHAVRQARHERRERRADGAPIGGRAVLHAGEGGAVVHQNFRETPGFSPGR